jgi:hypothetical protein
MAFTQSPASSSDASTLCIHVQSAVRNAPGNANKTPAGHEAWLRRDQACSPFIELPGQFE